MRRETWEVSKAFLHHSSSTFELSIRLIPNAECDPFTIAGTKVLTLGVRGLIISNISLTGKKVGRGWRGKRLVTMATPFGTELRRLRNEMRMTLVELAKPLNWSIVYLSDIERGRRNPPKPDDIVILLTTLGRMDDLHEMLRLADASRSSVRFDLEANRQNKEALADMLFALKRQVDQDRLESGTIECIRKMLESREDES